MKKYTYILLVLLALPVVFASCAKDDDETTYTDYCYISAFSLGSMKRVNYMTGSDGQDSSYLTTFQGSLFPMSINQRDLTIENLDSMPLRTRTDKVLATVTFEGVLAYRKSTLTADDDTLWTTYDSSDSIDFSEPLDFVVYANDGNSYRRYKVKINVHQQRGDSMVWNRLDSASAKLALSSMGDRKVAVWKNALWVIGEQSYATHALGVEGTWACGNISAEGTLVPQTLQRMQDKLYASTTDGTVMQSTDGITWTAASANAAGYQLCAASTDRLYALNGGNLYSSADGSAWIQEQLDADASNLPTSCVQGCLLTQTNGDPRLVLVGNGEKQTEIWSKSWTSDETSAEWMYYNVNSIDKHRLPFMSTLAVTNYDEGMVALGTACSRGGYKYAAMDSLFYSHDYGINWKTSDELEVDTTLVGLAANATRFSVDHDAEGHIWVVVDDEVWRGRTNRIGFKRQDD